MNELKTTTTDVPRVTITTTIPFTISTRKPYAIEDRQHFRYKLNNQDRNELDQSGKLLGRPSKCNHDSTNIHCIPSSEYADSTTTTSNDEVTTTVVPTTTESNIYETATELPDFPDLLTNRNIVDILTFKPPAAFSSRSGSIELTRKSDTAPKKPLICKMGNLDPRCPNPTPTGTPPTYLPSSFNQRSSPRAPIRKEPNLFTFPPSTTIVPTTFPPTTEEATDKTTDKFFICVPGSNDYRCDDYTPKYTEDNEIVTTTQTIQTNDIIDARSNGYKKCTDDSQNLGCKRVTTDLLTFSARTTTITPFSTERTAEVTTEDSTTENQEDNRTTPATLANNVDTTTRSMSNQQPEITTVVTSSPSTIKPPVCYPGALDPRCKQSRPFKPAPQQNMNSIISFGILNQEKNDLNTIKPLNIQSISNISNTQETVRSENIQSPKSKLVEQNAQDMSSNNYKPSSTSKPLNCYFGSIDPRCQRSTTIKTPASETIKEQTSNRTPVRANFQIPSNIQTSTCIPGSKDPKCQTPTTAKSYATDSSTTVTTTTPKAISGCYQGSFAL